MKVQPQLQVKQEEESAQVDLKREQERTLKMPVMKANFFLRSLFLAMDLVYGFGRSLGKFKSIEILARYPYGVWENASYHKLTRMYARTRHTGKKSCDNVLRIIELGRKSQDNEQWHMVVIDDIMKQKGIKQGWFKGYFIPRVLSFIYLGLSRVLYRLKPDWSFAMNAKFESHAEHEYMKMVQEHSEWDEEPVDTEYFEYYPRQSTMADLFRQIGLDERVHMNESLEEYERLTGRALVG